MKQLLVGVLVTLLAVMPVVSCGPKNVTVSNLPANVPQSAVVSWLGATQKLDEAYSATHTVQVAVIQLNKTPGADGKMLFPDGPIYGNALTSIGKAEILERDAALFLKTVPNDWSLSTTQKITTITIEVLTELSSASSQAVLGIKNSASAQQIVNLISNIINIIKIVQSLSAAPVVAPPAAPAAFSWPYLRKEVVHV
jgi:hypothetical protein